MRVYNFYSTSNEMFSYLRLPRKGRSVYSSTNLTQPFLREFPIEVFVQYNLKNQKLILQAQIKRENKKECLLANFEESEQSISEDLVEWENNEFKISLQAISNFEAYIVWENKSENSKQIIFSGKIQPLSILESIIYKFKNL